MQTKMCIKCKKNIAVVFISKIENGVTLNEGVAVRLELHPAADHKYHCKLTKSGAEYPYILGVSLLK